MYFNLFFVIFLKKNPQLAYTIEFLDPRDDCGGWIRIGYDANYRLRYSCNGELRPAFRGTVLSIAGVEAYLDFPDIEKGVVLQYTQHAAEVLLPALREVFTENDVRHNIPSDDILAASLIVSPSMTAELLAPCVEYDPYVPLSKEMGCNLCSPGACAIM